MYKFKLAQLPVSMSFPHFHASMTHDHYFQTSFLNNLHNNIIIILLIIRPYIPFKVPSHLKKIHVRYIYFLLKMYIIIQV